jgi:hypothetical protein
MNDKNQWIHFGQLGYKDFTKHLDEQSRLNYKLFLFKEIN